MVCKIMMWPLKTFVNSVTWFVMQVQGIANTVFSVLLFCVALETSYLTLQGM